MGMASIDPSEKNNLSVIIFVIHFSRRKKEEPRPAAQRNIRIVTPIQATAFRGPFCIVESHPNPGLNIHASRFDRSRATISSTACHIAAT
jgi:hypothetical protein